MNFETIKEVKKELERVKLEKKVLDKLIGKTEGQEQLIAMRRLDQLVQYEKDLEIAIIIVD